VRLFGERVFPVCSPKLLLDPRPLKQPADLKEHCLLQYDDRMAATRGCTGRPGWKSPG